MSNAQLLISVSDSINPYWKLALVFKCLTDNIMLDDFSTELKRIGGSAALTLAPAPEYSIAHPNDAEKNLKGLAEVENTESSDQRLRVGATNSRIGLSVQI